MTTKPFTAIDTCSNFFKIIFITLLTFLSSPTALQAQKEFDGLRGTHRWMRFTDAPNALYHHLAAQAYEHLDKRSGKIAELHTLEDWKERQEWIKATLSDIVGPFPEKTPLNAMITKVVKKDAYRVENLVYQSQPGFYVTASLFIPNGLKNGDKSPAIVYCSGHSSTAYRTSIGQQRLINLVEKGFVVLAFDPVGQGERLGYYDEEKDKSIFKWPTWEHSYPGAQAFMAGGSLARYMIWDGIRAVDYLLSRKEVDPKNIGITGLSGGGTQSAFIAAFDERIKAAAPGNYITNFARLYESMGPQDAEQVFTAGISRGLDMADILTARAPKPALVIATSRDMFPIQGTIETVREVSRAYGAYGKAANFGMASDDAPHGSTKKNRESMYAFFQKYLENPGDPKDREVQLLSEEELRVTETGLLSTSLKGETVFTLNLKEANEKRKVLESARKNLPDYFPQILTSAKELSGFREPTGTQEPVFTGRIQREGYTIEKYFVKGEGDYVIPYLLVEPENPGGKAVIYLHPLGKSADSGEGGEMEWFVKNGFTVLAPDMIGTGEMGPGVFKGDSYIDSTSYNLWFSSMLIGRSIVGLRAGDVVRLARLLKTKHEMAEVHGFAKGTMAPVLLHAAAFDEDIEQIVLVGQYSSYRSIVTNRLYKADFIHGAVPGSVGRYDLPDLAARLAPRKLIMVGVTDGAGVFMDADNINKELSIIKAAYREWGEGDLLHIVPGNPGESLQDSYRKWID